MAAEPEEKGEEAGEEAPPVDPVVRRSRIVGAAFTVAVAVVEFVTAAFESNVVLAGIWVLLGATTVIVAFYLFRGRFTAWGMSVILNTFALVIAVPLAFVNRGASLDVRVRGAAAIAVLAAQDVALFFVRLQFGVGAWLIEAGKEDDSARELIQRRTAAAAGLRCPKCGSEHLWVAEDGSAFCLACRAGTIEIARGGSS